MECPAMRGMRRVLADLRAFRKPSLAMNTISNGNPLIGFASSLLYGFADTVTVYLQLYSKLDLKLISALPYVFIILILVVVTIINNAIAKRKLARQALHAKSVFMNY